MARKKLDTLTEPMFYVLLSLRQERHGYGVMQDNAQLTLGRVKVSACTLNALRVVNEVCKESEDHDET